MIPDIIERLIAYRDRGNLTRGDRDMLADAANEIESLRASHWRLRLAIEYAHGEGFQWPSDPMAKFQSKADANGPTP